jgi:hypothetical protein
MLYMQRREEFWINGKFLAGGQVNCGAGCLRSPGAFLAEKGRVWKGPLPFSGSIQPPGNQIIVRSSNLLPLLCTGLLRGDTVPQRRMTV